MFPFVHFSKRPWIGPTLLMASLVLWNLTTTFPDRAPQPDSADSFSYLSSMEAHLSDKADDVLDRFTSQPYTVDLSIELDTAQTTTTTYLPGDKILVANCEIEEKLDRAPSNGGATLSDTPAAQQESLSSDSQGDYVNRKLNQKWELTGTWTESTEVRPKVKSLRCCVTLAAGENIDHDHLYRCLSAALGISLQRGDTLQIIEL